MDIHIKFNESAKDSIYFDGDLNQIKYLEYLYSSVKRFNVHVIKGEKYYSIDGHRWPVSSVDKLYINEVLYKEPT